MTGSNPSARTYLDQPNPSSSPSLTVSTYVHRACCVRTYVRTYCNKPRWGKKTEEKRQVNGNVLSQLELEAWGKEELLENEDFSFFSFGWLVGWFGGGIFIDLR